MASMEEQETIITANRADDFVNVWTSNTHDIAYFKKTAGFELVKETTYEGATESAEFRVPADRVNYRKILKAKRAPLTEEQRLAATERLKQARNA